MADWLVRSLKTAVQSFLGIVIPEICIILSGTLPGDIDAWKAVLFPIICTALSTAITAGWNIALEHFKSEENEEVE